MLLTTGICIPVIGAYWIQFVEGEFPCPLCLLQRLAMLGVAIGAMMNLRFGVRTSHYAVTIFSAIFGRRCLGTSDFAAHRSRQSEWTWLWFSCLRVALVHMGTGDFHGDDRRGGSDDVL